VALDIPLLLVDGPRVAGLDGLYPGLRIERLHGIVVPHGQHALAHAVLARRPRAIYYSELYDRAGLRELFGGRRDAPRVVYVPHGFSEKRQAWARTTAFQDIAVLYGQHAFDQLAAWGVAGYLHHFVLSGNLRRTYHAMHAAAFRPALAAHGLDGPHPERTLIYAPTWEDAIGSSSFFRAFASFANALPAGWRLVVKLHPHLESQGASIDRLSALYRGRDVILVRGSPLTFPFLDLADAYVGDMSSLAYDFLAYGRPMFFTNPTAGTNADAAGSRLFACGTIVAPERYDDLYRIVDDAWDRDAERYDEARAALEAYTHAPERTLDDVAGEMAAITAGVAPSWMYAKLAPPLAAR
jgi:hypothetical protein